MMNMAYIVNRKLKMAIFAIFYSLFSLFAVPAFAAFEDTGTGARPTVMGGTYVAAGDDVQSLMYNPAGLAQLNQRELSSEYSRLYAGLTDGSKIGQYFAGYGQPVKYGGTLAFGWRQLSLDNLYKERTLSLGYGEWITSRIAAGIALKQLHHSFEPPAMSVDDNGAVQMTRPTFFNQYGNASTAYSVDLGLLYRWTKRHTFGLAIQDINQPNIALNPADHEIVARTIRAGMAYRGDRGLMLAGGLTTRESLSNQKDTTWTGAIEKWWDMKDNGAIAARGSLATGSRSFQQMAMGSSYRYNAYQIDYAFVFNITGVSLGNTMGTHRFSFSYRFGAPVKEKIRVTDKPAQTAAPKRVAPKPSAKDLEALEDYKPAPEIQAPQAAKPEELALKQPAEDLMAGKEVPETAEMMNQKPAPTAAPSHADLTGPSMPVQVPAPVAVSELEEAPVQTPDLEVPVQHEAEAIAPVETLDRVDLLSRTDRMVAEYVRRTQARASASSRLGAFASLYPALKGYAQSQPGELLEGLDEGDSLDRSQKTYESLKWEGASLQQRLEHLAGVLETNLTSALRERAWDTQDMRDRRYKAWLETALAKGRRFAATGVTAHSRLVYWGEVARKALAYERQPSEPVPAPAPAPVKKSIPAVKTPQKQQAPAKPAPAPAQGVGRALSDGEWLYTVKEGDTLLSLANRYYGDYNRWRDIYILNQDRLGRGGMLRPGQILVMPPKKAR
jgi:hypothetical protein